ncbi:PEP/pyruvate-binding domain-containing protein [Streptosporangium sp. LJ11]|uniref:PEP/pyruvate-binding domain-containing protein n=1 Tax=Streptosporangium sp. LJ11 TaxID=3436927 RepID=UPI003F79933A
MNTLALADPRTELANVGGKGESLARLARAGLPVPPGFHVTTTAYRAFVTHHDLRDRILSSDAAEAAALFAAHEVPQGIADDIRAAYRELGDEPAVAVRSSATAEDLPGMSFAGQQDTFLNIRGAEQVLDAVRRCWASLWTERAIAYRERNGVPHDEVALAVVVQELVPADAAGVMFTEDRDHLSINAAWGLGEAIVGGLVTPDTITLDRADHTIVEEHIAAKTVMTVRVPEGTREVPVPDTGRDLPVLSRAQAVRLAELGMTIEELYGHAVDVEWAIHEGRPYILQARPITGQREVWNDSLKGDYLWTNGNLGEAIPSVMTPCTWSLVQAFIDEIMVAGHLGGHPQCGNIGGRVYMNMSLTASLGRALGMTKKIRDTQEPVYGRLPEGVETPLLPMSRWQTLKAAKPLLAGRRAIQQLVGRIPEYVASAPRTTEAIRVRIAGTADGADLAALWESEVEPRFRECNRMLAAAARQDAGSLIYLGSQLTKLVGEADAAVLMSGIQAADGRLESLGPLLGLARFKRGEISREEYVRRYGHRGPDEFEVSVARPVEDPTWLDRQIAGLTVDPTELLTRQDEASDAAWRRFRERYPRQAEKFRRKIDRWEEIVRAREETRSEMMRGFWMVRDFVVRAGEVTGHGDDLFFLTIEEVLDVLRGSRRPLSQVAKRRTTYELYKALPPYPGIIRGRFDPERWAADPNRRGDVFDAGATVAPPSQTISGFPGAAGVVEGIARVISSVADGDRLAEGEILVTTVTNVGWTLLFPRAAAVVTDVGAPLSHAAIVARELGIPAVVGTRNATMRIQDGDLIRVDGGQGSVEIVRVPAVV